MKTINESPRNRFLLLILFVVLFFLLISLACERGDLIVTKDEKTQMAKTYVARTATEEAQLTQTAIYYDLEISSERVVEENAPRFGQAEFYKDDSTMAEYHIRDETFSPGNWSVVKIVDGLGDGTASAGQGSGGNPGPYRKILHEWGGPGNIISGHLSVGSWYNPAEQGGIISLDFSYDLFLFDGGSSNAVAYRPLLFQDNIYFQYTGGKAHNALEPKWISFISKDLTADSFSAIGNQSQHPDFSKSGSPIQFGILAGNGRDYEGRTATDSGVDNWVVTIYATLP